MGVPDPDPDNSPSLSDIDSYLPVGMLAALLCDLLGEAGGLAMPWLATVDEPSQMLALEFGRAEQSINDIVAWAFRFGGTIVSHPCGALGELTQHVTTCFEFRGVTVSVFAFIPLSGQEDDQ